MSVLNLLGQPAPHLLYCNPGDDLVDIAQVLVHNQANAIAVLDEQERLIGILTEHDIMKATAKEGDDLDEARAEEWMSEQVVSCDIETKLTDALRLMGKHDIRHLIITEAGVAMAILSVRDILNRLYQTDALELNELRDVVLPVRTSLGK